MPRWLRLRLDAPLMSFGGVMVDAYGVVDPWPSASLLAGLFGNALGYDRTEADRLQRLQDRLTHACAELRAGEKLTDFQTAKLEQGDQGWTTRGAPEGRAGGAGTYLGPHLRWRDHWADRVVLVVARLHPAEEPPDLEALAAALRRPARPLFIGRKACLPSAPLFDGFVEAQDTYTALRLCLPPGAVGVVAAWPEVDGARPPDRGLRMTDRRDWRSGVHAGWSEWREGRLDAETSAP